MYETYQNYFIVIYYDESCKHFQNWAKSFWLLKSPHPIMTLQVDSIHNASTHLHDWLKANASEFSDKKALFAPVTTRPLIEIDLVQEALQNNRLGILATGSFVYCQLNPHSKDYTNTLLEEIFQDLGSPKDRQLIEQEILFMKDKLLMNV